MKPLFAAALVALIGLGACTSEVADRTPGEAKTARFLSQSGLIVLGDPDEFGRFEVLNGANSAAIAYWCAAGGYVATAMNKRGATRMYLEKPLSPSTIQPGSHAVTFTINPDQEMLDAAAVVGSPVSMGVKRIGENWGAEHGRSQCVRVKRFGFFGFR